MSATLFHQGGLEAVFAAHLGCRDQLLACHLQVPQLREHCGSVVDESWPGVPHRGFPSKAALWSLHRRLFGECWVQLQQPGSECGCERGAASCVFSLVCRAGKSKSIRIMLKDPRRSRAWASISSYHRGIPAARARSWTTGVPGLLRLPNTDPVVLFRFPV